MRRLFAPIALVMVLSALLVRSGVAQNTEGRWSLGFRGGVNQWFNDFNKRKIGSSAEFHIRYGLSRFFSLGIVAGYEELKSKQVPQFSFVPYDYLKLHAAPVTANVWLHLLPGRGFSPYLYTGGGALFYKREDGNKVYWPNKIRTSYVIPMGVGFEAFASKRVSIVVDLGFRLTDDKTDAYIFKKVDAYATAKAGFTFYLGSGDNDDDDNDRLTNGEERRLGTNPENPDTDGDGLKDGEEIKRYNTNPLKSDTDGDGLTDGDEVFKYKTDPAKTDTDGDGLSDGDEILKYKTDPLKTDSDGDGLSDGDEVTRYKSDPQKVDTDGDGLSDYDEVRTYKSDPAKTDTDGDGLSDGDEVRKYKTDPLKIDTDGGGINDGAETARGTNPLNPKDDIVKETIVLERGKTVILEGVNFNSGSATLTKNSERTLEKAFAALGANPDVIIEIAGYTDNVGKPDFNERLSLRRAQAVKAWLVKKGVAAKRMSTIGKGIRDPIAPNETADGRAENRRIEFHVQK